MFISLDLEKCLDKIQHDIMMNVAESVGIERTWLKTINATDHKPIANIILKNTQSNLTKIKNKTRLPILFTPIQYNT